jgi:urease accessory protein
MKKSTFITASLISAFSLVPTLAQAHPGIPGHTHGFAAGFAHPLLGLDHVLAMVAVGLWAAQLGGRARWAVPSAFVAVMSLGSALGMAGVMVPLVDSAILCSVVLLGLLVTMAVRVPLAASVALVGLFAVFHGLAHGAEMPANVSGLAYAVGFAIATTALHAVGFGFATVLQRGVQAGWVRAAGVAIALAGAVLIGS